MDEGGPKREFWRLLAMDMKAQVCAGGEDRLTLEHNVIGLQVSEDCITINNLNLFAYT